MLEPGEDLICTFNNAPLGSLVIRKQTLPDGDTTDLPFTDTSADLSGNLQDFENAGAELSETGTPGMYGTEETVPDGWVLTGIQCVGAINSDVVIDGAKVDVDLAGGETVICTYTNTKEGSLTIIKDAVGGDGEFSFNTTVPSVASPFIINTAVNDTNMLSDTLIPGTYTTSEILPTGWDLINIVCTGNTDSTITIGAAGLFDPGDESVTLDLLSGEDITCTFINAKAGTSTLTKLTVGGDDTFNFTSTLPAGNFSLTTVGGISPIASTDICQQGRIRLLRIF